MNTYEIVTLAGDTLTLQSTDETAVDAILTALCMTGKEILLDLHDWRGYEWNDGKDAFLSREKIESDLDCTGTDIHLDHCADITHLIADGSWLIKDGHAYCVSSWPSGMARKHIKRRCNFSNTPKQYPVWMRKLSHLKELGLQAHSFENGAIA